MKSLVRLIVPYFDVMLISTDVNRTGLHRLCFYFIALYSNFSVFIRKNFVRAIILYYCMKVLFGFRKYDSVTYMQTELRTFSCNIQ